MPRKKKIRYDWIGGSKLRLTREQALLFGLPVPEPRPVPISLVRLNHNRYHVLRGVRKDGCQFCNPPAAPETPAPEKL